MYGFCFKAIKNSRTTSIFVDILFRVLTIHSYLKLLCMVVEFIGYINLSTEVNCLFSNHILS